MPNGLAHQQWVCGLDLGPGSKRVLFVAGRAAAQAGARLVLVHVIDSGDRESVSGMMTSKSTLMNASTYAGVSITCETRLGARRL